MRRLTASCSLPPTGGWCSPNEALEQLFGYGRGALTGEAIETLVPARYAARHVKDRTTYAAAPSRRPMGLGMQLRGRRRDGSEFPVEISLAPLTTGGRR